MKIEFNIDTADLTKRGENIINMKMRENMDNTINRFFSDDRHYVGDKLVIERSDPNKQIDDIITRKFCDPAFVESIEKFIDHHWERLLEESLTKALQHRANKIAFQKVA